MSHAWHSNTMNEQWSRKSKAIWEIVWLTTERLIGCVPIRPISFPVKCPANQRRPRMQLDSSVEKLYKKKHINAPVGSTKASDLNPSGAPVTVPNTAHHSLHGPPLPSISELISSFSTLSIPPSDAPTATSDAPPSSCPIATLPSEVLVEILFQLALLDMAAFTRLAQVCKRLAFLVATEDRIWKRLCCGWEVGFGGMHYSWACDLAGRPVFNECSEPNSHIRRPPTYVPVPLTPIYPTYQLNLRRRPRIRFNGCYISTVNYVRPGATSVSQVSWNTPVHIVTYYRYLRFFRDGTVISLLSTAEPIDVVHHLTKENLANLNNPTTPTPLLPSTANTLRPALRGRWKLHGHPLLLLHASNSEGFQHHHRIEGDLTIETEGVDPRKYLYLMHLSLRTSSSVKNNNNNKKLIWRGYWSVNRLTHDLDEFGPRDARPFFWSRVGSYGAG